MHHFFISPEQLSGRVVRFDNEQTHQIHRVLRMRAGDRVLVLDGLGQQYETVIQGQSGGLLWGEVADQEPASGEPGVRIILFQSLLKREKFEWVLQKGTEIGVARFVPVITSRTLVREASDDKLVRWRRIIREAAEQSGRGRLPTLSPAITWAEALDEIAACDRAIIPWEEARTGGLRAALRDINSRHEPAVALFIGPEGGFDSAEVDAAVAHGARAVTLGPRILRTETAALAAAALVLYELGEMGDA